MPSSDRTYVLYQIVDCAELGVDGPQLEKHVREQAGDKEAAWDDAGKGVGTQIWRIEKFAVVEWPKDRYGSFYSGDSYIVLHVSTMMRVTCVRSEHLVLVDI